MSIIQVQPLASRITINPVTYVIEITSGSHNYGERPHYYSATAPTTPTLNMVWVKTDVTPNLQYRWNGTAWVAIGASGSGGGHTIQMDGVDLATETNLNFVGADIVDDPTNSATKVQGFKSIQFKTNNTPITNAEGLLQWNATDGTLDLGMSGGDVTMQIGQELFIKVINWSGSQIDNGSVVYISGRHGTLPKIDLAKGDSETTANVVGIVTQDIAHEGVGFVTTFGYVRGIKTNYSTWAEGDLLYLSKTTAGTLENSQPSIPNHSDIVATVAVVGGAGVGSILVNCRKHKTLTELSDVNGTPLASDGQIPVWDNTNKYFDFTKNANSFRIYHGIETPQTITFDNSTHILTIAAGLKYWNQGVSKTNSAATTCDIDDFETLTTNKIYYFYFDDASGVLKCSDSYWSWRLHTYVCTVYWNGSAGAVQKELHNQTRDIDWHIWAHDTIGTRYESGLDKTNPTTVNDGLLQIETGVIHDEDQDYTTGLQQVMRAWYKVSASVYTWADYSLPYVGTLGQVKYLRTSDYSLQNVGATNYAVMWVYASLDIDRPIYIIPTHAASDYNNLPNARAELAPNLLNLGLNPEMKLIYKFIYRGDGQFQESTDYRTTSTVGGSASGTMSAGSVSFNPSGNVAATNVQAAIEELDNEKTATTDSRLSDARSIKFAAYQNTDATITSTTDETILANLLIAANSMGANDKMLIEAMLGKVGTAGGGTVKLYINATSNTLVGATQIGVYTVAATTTAHGFRRQIVNKNSQSINNSYPAGTTAFTEWLASTGARVNVNADFAVNQWIILTYKLANTADVGRLDDIQIVIQKP